MTTDPAARSGNGVVSFGAAATYNAAADSYDAEPLSFWARYGRRTIDRMALTRGAGILDVCSGSGASALPAAEVVGPEGSVTAIDVADQLLELARRKAAERGLTNIEFHEKDMTELNYANESFDAIVCVFGIFFVTDMEAQLARLWRMLRPGGKLAVTTWGAGLFEPANEVWQSCVRKRSPHLVSESNPWDRITTHAALLNLFAATGIRNVEILPEAGHQPLERPEDFWVIARGSGLRQTIEQLEREAAEDLKRELVDVLRRRAISQVRTDVIYSIAHKTPFDVVGKRSDPA